MPTERLYMRHIREVLRLHHGVGNAPLPASLTLAQGTASKYLNRTRRAGLTWPLPPELERRSGSRTGFIRRTRGAP